jgi:peptide/nickel transport system permease protein
VSREIALALLLRGLRFIAVLLGAVAFVEILLWAAPGDPIDLVPNGPELRAALSAEWGLDRPLGERLLARLSGIIHGDLGESLVVRPGASVSALTLAAATRSVGVLACALLLSVGLALLLALSAPGRSTTARFVQLASAAPVFLLAWGSVTGLNVATFALMEQGLIDRPDWFALPLTDSPLRSAVAITALAIGSSALSDAHAELGSVLGRLHRGPLVLGLRARDTPLGPHLLSNLLAPLAALAADRLAFLLGGLVVVEAVLLSNGAGALLWQAALKRDYPLAAGLTLVAAGVVTAGRLLADLAQLIADPRLRDQP